MGCKSARTLFDLEMIASPISGRNPIGNKQIARIPRMGRHIGIPKEKSFYLHYFITSAQFLLGRHRNIGLMAH
jgi:hypothetical protein